MFLDWWFKKKDPEQPEPGIFLSCEEIKFQSRMEKLFQDIWSDVLSDYITKVSNETKKTIEIEHAYEKMDEILDRLKEQWRDYEKTVLQKKKRKLRFFFNSQNERLDKLVNNLNILASRQRNL